MQSGCANGDACGFSHSVFEAWLHPLKYRTQLCKHGRQECTRSICFFAHGAHELRTAPAVEKIYSDTEMQAAAITTSQPGSRAVMAPLGVRAASSPTLSTMPKSHISHQQPLRVNDVSARPIQARGAARPPPPPPLLTETYEMPPPAHLAGSEFHWQFPCTRINLRCPKQKDAYWLPNSLLPEPIIAPETPPRRSYNAEIAMASAAAFGRPLNLSTEPLQAAFSPCQPSIWGSPADGEAESTSSPIRRKSGPLFLPVRSSPLSSFLPVDAAAYCAH